MLTLGVLVKCVVASWNTQRLILSSDQNFLCITISKPASGPMQYPVQCDPGTVALVAKQLKHGAHLSCVQVRNIRSCARVWCDA